MPHLTMEYSGNLEGFDPAGTLQALNTMLAGSGCFETQDIKSRAIRLEHFLVGMGQPQQGFVHVRLAILEGRPEPVRQMLAQSLLGALQASVPPQAFPLQLCAETLPIERATYAKSAHLAARPRQN